MGLIWGIVLFLLGVAGAILIPVTARVVGDDIKEWLPWITRRLVELAVSRLSEQDRDRFEEEWSAHINELPGNLAKVYAAWGCLSASKAINHIALSGDTTRVEEALRRAMDILLAVFFLILVFPLFVLISILIKLDSPGPLLSKHKRLGAENMPFNLLKFRSTYVEDPRRKIALTRVGKILCAVSLDELPQIINVLRGEMAVLGPLPTPASPTAADTSDNRETPIRRWRKPDIIDWAVALLLLYEIFPIMFFVGLLIAGLAFAVK